MCTFHRIAYGRKSRICKRSKDSENWGNVDSPGYQTFYLAPSSRVLKSHSLFFSNFETIRERPSKIHWDGCLEMSHPCLKYVCAPQNTTRRLLTQWTKWWTIFFPWFDHCVAIFRSNAQLLLYVRVHFKRWGPPFGEILHSSTFYVSPDSSRRCAAYQEAPKIKSRDPTPCS